MSAYSLGFNESAQQNVPAAAAWPCRLLMEDQTLYGCLTSGGFESQGASGSKQSRSSSTVTRIFGARLRVNGHIACIGVPRIPRGSQYGHKSTAPQLIGYQPGWQLRNARPIEDG